MRIDIFTSILRREYPKNDISEIWDTAYERYRGRSNLFKNVVLESEQPVLRYLASDTINYRF